MSKGGNKLNDGNTVKYDNVMVGGGQIGVW